MKENRLIARVVFIKDNNISDIIAQTCEHEALFRELLGSSEMYINQNFEFEDSTYRITGLKTCHHQTPPNFYSNKDDSDHYIGDGSVEPTIDIYINCELVK